MGMTDPRPKRFTPETLRLVLRRCEDDSLTCMHCMRTDCEYEFSFHALGTTRVSGICARCAEGYSDWDAREREQEAKELKP